MGFVRDWLSGEREVETQPTNQLLRDLSDTVVLQQGLWYLAGTW